MRSPEVVAPSITAVPFDPPAACGIDVWVVTSEALHAHALGAVTPAKVMVAVQVPLVPETNCPVVDPPNGEEALHPETVKVEPLPTNPAPPTSPVEVIAPVTLRGTVIAAPALVSVILGICTIV
jgi:hypothetical protein